MTAAEIARALGCPIGTVYSLASRHRWRRSAGRPVRYNVDDVIATMAMVTPG